MVVTITEDMSMTGQKESTEVTIGRGSLMQEHRTDTLAVYSLIPDRDSGLTEWLSIMGDVADPRLCVHWGADELELGLMVVPMGANELHYFSLALDYSREEAIALAAIAFPDKYKSATAVNAPDSRSKRF